MRGASCCAATRGARGETLQDGTAEAVTSSGALRVRDCENMVHEVSSGEVSVRIQNDGSAAEA